MGKYVGEGVNSDVIKQIELRQDLVGKKSGIGPNASWQQLFTSNTGWIKLSSSVNTADTIIDNVPQYLKNPSARSHNYSAALAESKVLTSLGIDGSSSVNPGYDNTTLGTRPVPGITGMTVTTKNRFGTLRSATVNFKVTDVEQLDEMEKLYMRPGFSVLLEWGHSVYATDNSTIVTTPKTFGDKYYFTNNTNSLTAIIVESILERRRKESKYNYEGLFGYVKNFQWKFNVDGTYDCTVYIISRGEVLESLQYELFHGSKSNAFAIPNADDQKKYKSPFHMCLYEFIEQLKRQGGRYDYRPWETSPANVGGPGLLGWMTSVVYRSVTRSNPYITTVIGNQFKIEEGEDSPTMKAAWIPFGLFMDMVNEYCLLKDEKNYPISKFGNIQSHIGIQNDDPRDPWWIKAKQQGGYNYFDIIFEQVKDKFVTYPGHFSHNPGVCLLPFLPVNSGRNEVDEWKNWGAKLEQIQDRTAGMPHSPFSTQIRDILVNCNFIIETLNKHATGQGAAIFDVVKEVLAGMQRALGDINEFDITYDEENDLHWVVDRKFVGSKTTLPEINVSGLNSVVTDLSVTSKLSAKVGTMLAISSQASRNATDVGIEAEHMFRWNSGLKDRIATEKQSMDFYHFNTNQAKKAQTKYDQAKEQISITTNYTRNDIFDQERFNGLYAAHRFITQKEYLDFINDPSRITKKPAPGIIPFEVEMTLDGISGLKIGEVFKVKGSVLPATYKDMLAFIIVGLEHSFQGNKWKTHIKAQTITAPS